MTNQWLLLVVVIGFFVLMPLLAIGWTALGGVGEMWDHVLKNLLYDYVANSLFLLFGTACLTVLIGVSCAWIITQYRFKFRTAVEFLLFLPLAIPSYIVAYTYTGIFDHGGTLSKLGKLLGLDIPKIDFMNIYGLIWILSISLFPYVYASARAIFIIQSKSLKEAAFLLGASQRSYFWRIALPLARPAIIAGLFLVSMEVLNDYGAAKYYGVNTFTTGIFRTWTALEDLQTAIYLSILLVLLVLGLSLLERLQRGKRNYSLDANRDFDQQIIRPSLKGSQKIGSIFILSIPLLFGFIMPVAQLIYWAVLSWETQFNTEILSIALQSLVVALTSAFIIIVLALALIYFTKWSRSKLAASITKISTIGYVIPGAIIGIGIISISQTFIESIEDLFQLRIGYYIYNSVLVLIYAYIFRFLAITYNPIESNVLRIQEGLSEASYLMGKGRIQTFFRIELPLLKGVIISAFLLVFIDILKELPLTLILKPYHIQTLAIKAYEYADDERIVEVGLPALMLVLIILILMFVVNKLNNRTK